MAVLGRFRHDARRDTLWVGKSGGLGWLIAGAAIAGGVILAFLLHR